VNADSEIVKAMYQNGEVEAEDGSVEIDESKQVIGSSISLKSSKPSYGPPSSDDEPKTLVCSGIVYLDEIYPVGEKVEGQTKQTVNLVGQGSRMGMWMSMMPDSAKQMLQAMMGTTIASKSLTLRNVGGNSVPSSVAIYPNDFETKYLVTDYLDAWNETHTEPTEKIVYTDTLELIIGLINNMIDMISTALIAFTSISLVVSTVMIGIITYVSVVERVKEIGIIRSLGGRKRDVSYLFNAETFIIGLLAGIIGIATTCLVAFVANMIFEAVVGIPSLVIVTPYHATILILLSVGLTLISGLIPSRSAAKKDPIEALRSQ
jgi:ABC-type antimicrobial peptide transport system permease subunit